MLQRFRPRDVETDQRTNRLFVVNSCHVTESLLTGDVPVLERRKVGQNVMVTNLFWFRCSFNSSLFVRMPMIHYHNCSRTTVLSSQLMTFRAKSTPILRMISRDGSSYEQCPSALVIWQSLEWKWATHSGLIMVWEILMHISLDERGLPGGQLSDDEHFEEILFQRLHCTVLRRKRIGDC